MKKVYVSVVLSVLMLFAQGQTTQQVAINNNMFAFQLFRQVNTDNANVFYSPISISASMAMAYTGAKGMTAMEMQHAMHFEGNERLFGRGLSNLLRMVLSVAADTTNHIQLSLANSIWVSDSLHLKPNFMASLMESYHAQYNKINFTDSGARTTINSWVDKHTMGKIENLLPNGALDPLTKMVLVNAIYFNAKWAQPFSKQRTLNKLFYAGKDSVNAAFMNTTRDYNYYSDSNLQAVELPYKGNKVSMVVFLPKDQNGISKLTKVFDQAYYARVVDSMHIKKVRLSLPKFKTTDEFQLVQVLEKMGMRSAFSARADFSGMATEQLFINKVIHKAFVSVTEDGTEAAAATAVVMDRATVMNPSLFEVFNANHPFMFLIRNNTTGCILFMGKIADPAK